MAFSEVRSNQLPPWVLGTAQLGLPYGAANLKGMPSEEDALTLVRYALDAGVSYIDTARAYGESERRLGRVLAEGSWSVVEVTTKLDPLAHVPPEASPETAVAAASASLEASHRALRRERLDAVLLHRVDHLTAWEGSVWSMLIEKQRAGLIGRLGVSLQTPEEAYAALAEPMVAQIQLPFNVVDWRWEEAGVIEAIRQRRDIVVHVRSVFLQGLLPGGPAAHWPRIPGVDGEELINVLRGVAESCNRVNITDLCLAFVRAHDWINGIIIGMETRGQLEDNLTLLTRTPLTPEQVSAVRADLPHLPELFLIPSRWSEFGTNGQQGGRNPADVDRHNSHYWR